MHYLQTIIALQLALRSLDLAHGACAPRTLRGGWSSQIRWSLLCRAVSSGVRWLAHSM